MILDPEANVNGEETRHRDVHPLPDPQSIAQEVLVPKQSITSNAAPPPGGAYSSAIRWRDLLFVSGQTPRDRDRRLVDGPFTTQADQTFENLNAVAMAAGASPADALRVTVYLQDMDDFAEMDAAFAKAFPEPRPARTTVQSNLSVAIEVDGVFAIEPADQRITS